MEMPTQLEQISGLSDEEHGQLRGILSEEPCVTEAILYGSRAMGTHRPGSDVDITLVGAGLTTRRLLDLSHRIDDLMMPYTFDLSILDQIDSQSLMDHIKRVGKVIYRYAG